MTADANAVQGDAFTWSDSFVLGYHEMDDTHREFVQVVQRLLDCPDAELLAAMDAFERHAREHFGMEDEWMSSTGYPPGDCHQDEHAAVLKSTVEVRELVAQGRVDIGRDFAQELVKWFPGHAQYLDSALAHWMFKRQYGGKPVVIRRVIDSPVP